MCNNWYILQGSTARNVALVLYSPLFPSHFPSLCIWTYVCRAKNDNFGHPSNDLRSSLAPVGGGGVPKKGKRNVWNATHKIKLKLKLHQVCQQQRLPLYLLHTSSLSSSPSLCLFLPLSLSLFASLCLLKMCTQSCLWHIWHVNILVAVWSLRWLPSPVPTPQSQSQPHPQPHPHPASSVSSFLAANWHCFPAFSNWKNSNNKPKRDMTWAQERKRDTEREKESLLK